MTSTPACATNHAGDALASVTSAAPTSQNPAQSTPTDFPTIPVGTTSTADGVAAGQTLPLCDSVVLHEYACTTCDIVVLHEYACTTCDSVVLHQYPLPPTPFPHTHPLMWMIPANANQVTPTCWRGAGPQAHSAGG